MLFSSVGKEVLAYITSSATTAKAWRAVDSMFTAQTRARTMNVQLALTTTKKGTMSITDYFAKMRGYADEMAASGKPLDNEELVAHVCNGLDSEYNPVVSALVTRVESISITELYAQLVSFETRLDLQQDGSGSSSSHVANRGGGRGGRGSGDSSRGCSNRGRGTS